MPSSSWHGSNRGYFCQGERSFNPARLHAHCSLAFGYFRSSASGSQTPARFDARSASQIVRQVLNCSRNTDSNLSLGSPLPNCLPLAHARPNLRLVAKGDGKVI